MSNEGSSNILSPSLSSDISDQYSRFLRIDHNISELLDGIDIHSPIHMREWSERKHAVAIWILRYVQGTLTYMKVVFCHFSQWSDDDKGSDLSSLLSQIESALKNAKTQFETDITKANQLYEGDKFNALIILYGSFLDFERKPWGLVEKPLPPFSYPVVFDEFVGSVQSLVQLIPAQLQAFFFPGLHLNVMDFYRGGILSNGYEGNDWPSSGVDECVVTLVTNLEILKCFLANFVKHCIDKEKWQPVLARAEALVFSIAHLSWQSVYQRHTYSFTELLFHNFSLLSGKISRHNQEVKEIYPIQGQHSFSIYLNF